MPIYEYECKDCGYQEALIQKMNEQPLTKCPKCGGRFQKKLSAPAIRFKGSGFYITDYTNKSSSTASKGSGGKNENVQKGQPKKGSPKKNTLAS